jgi:act minimal PKS acyl carrier protein
VSEFTIENLKVIVREASGVADGVALDADTIDTPLRDIGYDSLAVLEIASRIQRDFHLVVSDEAIEGMKTGRDIIGFVNSQLAAAV